MAHHMFYIQFLPQIRWSPPPQKKTNKQTTTTILQTDGQDDRMILMEWSCRMNKLNLGVPGCRRRTTFAASTLSIPSQSTTQSSELIASKLVIGSKLKIFYWDDIYFLRLKILKWLYHEENLQIIPYVGIQYYCDFFLFLVCDMVRKVRLWS